MSAASRRPGRAPASEGRSRTPFSAAGDCPSWRTARSRLSAATGSPGRVMRRAAARRQRARRRPGRRPGRRRPRRPGAWATPGHAWAVRPCSRARTQRAPNGGMRRRPRRRRPGRRPGQPCQCGQAPEQGDQRPGHGGVPGRERGPRPDRAAHRALRGRPAPPGPPGRPVRRSRRRGFHGGTGSGWPSEAARRQRRDRPAAPGELCPACCAGAAWPLARRLRQRAQPAARVHRAGGIASSSGFAGSGTLCWDLIPLRQASMV